MKACVNIDDLRYNRGVRSCRSGQAQLLLEVAAATPHTDYCTIPITKGQVALVDPEDYEWLSGWNWRVKTSSGGRKPYAYRYDGGGRAATRGISMHRQILGLKADDPRQGDHRNGNGLDNRSANLRIDTVSENNRNAQRKNTTTGLRGVYRHRDKFGARIRMDGKTLHLGVYETAELAAAKYIEAAQKYHGEFARVQ